MRDEPHSLPALDPRSEPCWRVQGDDASAVDQRHPVTQPLGLLHKVRDQQDRRTAVTDLLDEPPGVEAALRVQARRHLIEHRDPWPADERQRHRQPLPLAAGQGPVVVAALSGEPERLGQFRGVGGASVESAVHVEDLAHPELGRERAVLKLHADDLADLIPVGPGIEAEQPDGPAVRFEEPADALDRGGFPRAVRPQDAEDFALGHRERHVVHRRHGSVALAEVGDGHGRGPWRRAGLARFRQPGRVVRTGLLRHHANLLARPAPAAPAPREQVRAYVPARGRGGFTHTSGALIRRGRRRGRGGSGQRGAGSRSCPGSGPGES
jgi:hypothetical protein